MLEEYKKEELREYLIIGIIAIGIWYIIFIWQPLSFWISMFLGVLFLVLISLILKGVIVLPTQLSYKDFFGGLFSSFILYFIFWISYKIGIYFYPDLSEQVNEVYILAEGYNPWFLGFLMLCFIGPGEEIFWRGFLQQHLEKRYSSIKAFLLVTFGYILVHLITGNFALIGASILAGIFWGGLYLWQKSLAMLIISHSIWEILIFLIFPIK